jgi:hypothetical protein
MGRLGLSEHSKCVARVRARIVAGFVARYARRCLADRVIGAESLEPALTFRDAKAKAGQNPPQFVYADPDVICPRDGFHVSQPGLLEFHQKRSPALLCGHGVVRQEVTAIQISFGEFRSYEFEVPQESGRDKYSTGDVWVTVYRGDSVQ